MNYTNKPKKIKLKVIKNSSTGNIFRPSKTTQKKVTNSQSIPKNKFVKTINNNSYNDYNYYQIIKNKTTIEDYFYNNYMLEYLNPEEIDKLNEIRNEIYPNYEHMKYYVKIEKIKDNYLQNGLKNDANESTIFNQLDKGIELEQIKKNRFYYIKRDSIRTKK